LGRIELLDTYDIDARGWGEDPGEGKDDENEEHGPGGKIHAPFSFSRFGKCRLALIDFQFRKFFICHDSVQCS
jgi:hypothetical protein